MLPRQGLQLSCGHLHLGLKGRGKNGSLIVHTAQLEHQGGGLHGAVLLPAQREYGAALGGHVSVSCGVHGHCGQVGASSRFVLADDAAELAVLTDNIAHKCV